MNSDTPLLPVARRWLENDRSALFATALLLAIAIPCLLAPLAAPYDPSAQPDIIGSERPPSADIQGNDPSAAMC